MSDRKNTPETSPTTPNQGADQAQSSKDKSSQAKSAGDKSTRHKPADKTSADTSTDKGKKTTSTAKADSTKPEHKKPESKKPESKKQTAAKKSSGGGFTGLIAWLSLLLAAGLAAAAWYGWQLYQQQQNTLSLAQANLQQTMSQQFDAVVKQQQQQAEQIKQQQDALMVNINEVHSRLGNTTRDWMLSEAHYLLQLGNQQAQLADNLNTAKVALELADKRLQAVGEPALLAVRKQITKELESLKAISLVDIDGLVLKLGELASQTGKLILRSNTLPQNGTQTSEAVIEGTSADLAIDKEAGEQGWRAMLHAIWASLKSLVTVRYHEEAAQPLLAPEHARAIRDSLELKLNQARLAALQKNTAVFQDSVKHSIDWLQRYFDSKDALTANMIASLQGWQKLELKPAIPDISKSRRMLIDAASRMKMTIQNQPAKKSNSGNKKSSEKKSNNTPADKTSQNKAS